MSLESAMRFGADAATIFAVLIAATAYFRESSSYNFQRRDRERKRIKEVIGSDHDPSRVASLIYAYGARGWWTHKLIKRDILQWLGAYQDLLYERGTVHSDVNINVGGASIELQRLVRRFEREAALNSQSREAALSTAVKEPNR